MRIVDGNSKLWREVGVGATEVASIMGCAVEEDRKVFVALAKLVQSREWKLVRKAPQLEQDSPEWHDWRLKGVGGSEVANVMGKNPYKGSSPLDLFNDKTNPQAKKKFENPAMAWGKANEPTARSLYENLMGWTAAPLCCLHDDHDFVRCSLDGIRPGDDLVLEIKCPGERNHQKFLSVSQVEEPLDRQRAFAGHFDYYRYQVLYQLLITGARRCHFVSYCPRGFPDEQQFALIELFPEPFEQERVLERVVEFWGYVERRELPPTEWLRPAGRPPEVLGGAVDD